MTRPTSLTCTIPGSVFGRAGWLAPCLLVASVTLAAAQPTVVRTIPGQDAPASGWYAHMTDPFTVGLGVTHPAPTIQAAQPPLPQKGLVSPPIRPGGGRLTVVMDPSDPALFWSYQELPTNDCMPVEKNGGKYGTAWVAFRIGAAGLGTPR